MPFNNALLIYINNKIQQNTKYDFDSIVFLIILLSVIFYFIYESLDLRKEWTKKIDLQYLYIIFTVPYVICDAIYQISKELNITLHFYYFVFVSSSLLVKNIMILISKRSQN